MTLKKLAAAAAAGATLLPAGAAFALPPSATPNITITAAGNTAANNFLLSLFRDRYCKAGTLDVYQDADVNGKGTFFLAYFCTFDSTKITGLTVKNPNVLLLKRTKNNAELGVYPLLEPDKKIDIMGITNTVTVGGTSEPQCTETAAGSKTWNCRTDRPGDTYKITPDFGVADVNPALFRGVNYNPTVDGINFKQASAAAVSKNLTVKDAGSLVFGLPVTKNLRDALQEAQIDQGKLEPDCIGNETERCMPNLSKALIANLYAGRIGKWSDIKVEYTPTGATKPVSVPLTNYGTAGRSDTLVRLCRRNRGAGQQAIPNVFFLNNPCGSSAVAPTEASNPLTGPVTHILNGVVPLETCLTDYNDGTNNSGLNTANAKAWAVGVLATDRNANLAKNYRFVKIDGYAPTLQEAAAGHYLYTSEGSINWRKVAPKPTGNVLKILEKVAADASNPTILANFNKSAVHPWGQSGYLAVSSQGFAVKQPFDPNYPVTPYTHAPTGLALDNCRPPLLDTSKNGKASNL
jgi:hypothetical protein